MLIRSLCSALRHARCVPHLRRFCSAGDPSSLGAWSSSSSLRYTAKQEKPKLLNVYPEVEDAVANGKPVVALESTIITHGMPYPQNLSVAKEVVQIVRDNGAIPATIAIINGRIHVGLSKDELEAFADPSNQSIKTSRRDMAYILSQGLSGSTTVSGTMIAAHKTGINIFVTGGIGGVHRGAQTTFDISADLTELGRTPVAVICAGVKSILDIGLTLEYLETQGVPVATFGSSNDFPAFFTPNSGYQSSCLVKTPLDAATMIDCNLSLGLQNGLVIAVPIPASEAALGSEIEAAIKHALHEASSSNIHGRDVTPFILKRVNELTQGQSLAANIALIKNNAKVGSQIAVELSRIRQSTFNLENNTSAPSSHKIQEKKEKKTKARTGRPVVVGGSNVDFIATAEKIIPEASNPGKVRMSFGGVGRNIAEALSRLGKTPIFVSAVGGDPLGAMVIKHCQDADMSTGGIHIFDSCQTATYSAVLSNAGDFNVGVGDMDIHQKISPQTISGFEESIQNAPMVIVDGNLSKETMEKTIDLSSQHNIPVWFEPTCLTKGGLPFQTDSWQKLTYISPNMNELRTMSDTLVQYHNLPRHPRVDNWVPRDSSVDDIIEECLLFSQPIMTHVHCLVITLGKNGVLICRNTTADCQYPTARKPQLPTKQNHLVSAVHYPALVLDDVVNVTGAGDSLAAAMVLSIIRGYSPDVCVKLGIMAAVHSLRSRDTIAQSITAKEFTQETVEQFYDMKPVPIDISFLR